MQASKRTCAVLKHRNRHRADKVFRPINALGFWRPIATFRQNALQHPSSETEFFTQLLDLFERFGACPFFLLLPSALPNGPSQILAHYKFS
jgi:hypothetical protein